MPLTSLPKTLVAKTPAAAADVMADLNALLKVINGEIDGENLAESIRNAIIPVGSVILCARPAAPTGFLICAGQAVSRTAFAALFGVIGTIYGAGDGASTFNLPDLRGRTAYGPDSGTGRNVVNGALGQGGGDQHMQSHTHEAAGNTGGESQSHQHSLPMIVGNRHEGEGFGYPNWNAGATAENTGTESQGHTHTVNIVTTGAGAGASDNMPPFAVLNYVIKF